MGRHRAAWDVHVRRPARAGGAVLGRPSTRVELPAAPGSGEHRLPWTALPRYRVIARTGVGIGRPCPSEWRPREGPGHWEGVWFGHVRPIRPDPNPKR